MCWIGTSSAKIAEKDIVVYKIGKVLNNKFRSLYQNYFYSAKEEGAYKEDFDAFEQEVYDQGFYNAIYFMLWNPSERSCSNCQYQNSRELCGEEYCGQKYWSPKVEE